MTTTMNELMTAEGENFALDGILTADMVSNYYTAKYGEYKSSQTLTSLLLNWRMQNALLLDNLKAQLSDIGAVFDKSHVITYHKEGHNDLSGQDVKSNDGTQKFKKGNTQEQNTGTDTTTIGAVEVARSGNDKFSEGQLNERTYETAFDSAAEKLKTHFQHETQDDTTTYNSKNTTTHTAPDTIQYGRTLTKTQSTDDVRTDDLTETMEYGKKDDYEEDYYGSGTFNPLELLQADIKLKAYDLVYQYLDSYVYRNFHYFYTM